MSIQYTYYKFKSQERANELAKKLKAPILAHEHWTFAWPSEAEESSNAPSFSRLFSVANCGERCIQYEDVEPVDLKFYPQYITVQDLDGRFHNIPIRMDDPYNRVTTKRYCVMTYYNKYTGTNLKVTEMIPYVDDGDWSEIRRKSVNIVGTYLKDQIRTRYGFFERPSSGLNNVIVDSYFPRLLYCCNMDIHNLANYQLPKTAVAISPLVANILNVKQVPTEQLCRVLGYNTKMIKTLLKKVKDKKLTFVFAGAGGTGMNTAYFLREMCRMTDTVNLFRKVLVYDQDTVELSNLLRFPVDVRSLNTTSTHKVDLIAPFTSALSTNKPEYHKSFIGISENGSFNYPHHGLYSWLDNDDECQTHNDVVIYGAPSVESRNALSKVGNFICATHAATTCSIWLNPHQNTELQVESYGMIQLGGFFMNQLKMAISLLEILGRDDLDLKAQDVELLDFEFDGTIQMRTDRQYNWQIDPNLLMMTEHQAATNIIEEA